MGDAKGPNNNSLCCDAEDVSLDNLDGIGACKTMAAAITNTSGGNDSAQNNIEPHEGEPNENQDGEPAEGQEGDLTENQSDEPTEAGKVNQLMTENLLTTLMIPSRYWLSLTAQVQLALPLLLLYLVLQSR
eukprot:87186_1